MESKPPDLVVSDMMMPVMDGYAMLGAMRARPALKFIPVILTSAVRRNNVLTREALREFSGFLREPFKFDEFLGLVESLTGPRAPDPPQQ